MIGPNSILDMARQALFAHQACIQVTGENIANVNTPGYARRAVTLVEAQSIDFSPGQIGLGVDAQEVTRYFDEFVERLYYDQSALQARWDTTYTSLSSVESMFNESSGLGISNSLSEFFNAWNELSAQPEDYGTRRSLMNDTETLCSTLHQNSADLSNLQLQADQMIQQDVDSANQLIKDIAEINRQLNLYDEPGSNNANGLYDQRGLKLRELDGILGINVIDNGGGNITVTTKGGQNLVDGAEHFSLSFDSAKTTQQLLPGSNFDGQVYFEGSDSYEYTIEITRPGMVTSDSSAAMFKVSLDGGKTFLKGDDGQELEFYARPEDGKVQVGDLKIWFGQADDSSSAPTTALDAQTSSTGTYGDRFTIVPKKALYWVKNTSTKENITPQIYANGEDNSERLTGGTLAGLFNFRDQYLGNYQDKLDAMSESLIWEVNRRHSQGAGLEKFGIVDGAYTVTHDDRALASDSTGLVFGDRLQSGNSMFYIYNASTGLLVSGGALDWSAAAGVQNFDPSTCTLEDVAAAYNRTFGSYVNATIVNHRLQITAKDGYQFAFGTDTAGINAALGLNVYFQGSTARDINAADKVGTDLDYICAGHVNGGGEANQGDNETALDIYGLKDLNVAASTIRDGTTSQTILEYYNALVGNVGSDTAAAQYNYQFNSALAQELDNRQQQAMGVNLDEEMANLIKYQHAYTAAAKLVTTADQMMQTLLALKS